jgi:hypothetical protein
VLVTCVSDPDLGKRADANVASRACVAVLIAPSLRTAWGDDQVQASAVGQFAGSGLRLGVGDLDGCQCVVLVSHRVRWVLGTHHGSVQPAHLDSYLDEFVFRFNRRTSTSRGMLFYRLMQQAVVTPPVTYKSVTKGLPPPDRGR